MASAAKFQVMTLTDAAAERVKELVENSDKNAIGLRVGIKKGGCAGMEYTMEFVDEADKNDEIVDQDGARVMIAPMAQMFLFGTEIDYQTSLLESGFHFNNPNVADACGCGESIKFKDVEELQAERGDL